MVEGDISTMCVMPEFVPILPTRLADRMQDAATLLVRGNYRRRSTARESM
jgi:hypothetical protein